MQHYIDYLQEALITGVDLRVMDRDGKDHKLIYVPYTSAEQTWAEGFYIQLQGIQTNIRFDLNPGIPRENPYILTARSVGLLCDFALRRTVTREAYVLAPALAALKEEFGAQLQFMVVKDYRLIEKDRGALLLHFGPVQNSEASEKRLSGFMADASWDGFRIDKHTVSAWRMRPLVPEEWLMQIFNEAVDNHGSYGQVRRA